MPTETNTEQTLEVFFSYAHEDEMLRDRLAKHLSILERQNVISAWHDRQIGASKEWTGEISEHLERAQIILLLVSADFLASDYCYDIEMRRALERHEANKARVIPIILRPVNWQGASFSNLQALPKNRRPVTSWPDIENAFLDIARGIRLVTQEFEAHQEEPVNRGKHLEVTPEAGAISWYIKISGTTSEIETKMGAILEFMQRLSGDPQLTIKMVESGSVKIYFEGSEKGFLKTKSLFEKKKLRSILDYELLDVKVKLSGGKKAKYIKPSRRIFPRNQYEAPIQYTLDFQPDRYYNSRTYNFSQGGFYFESFLPLELNTQIIINMPNYSPETTGPEAFQSYLAVIRWCQKLSDEKSSRFGVGVEIIKRSHERFIIIETQKRESCDLCGELLLTASVCRLDGSIRLCSDCFHRLDEMPESDIKFSIKRFLDGAVL